MTQSIVIVGTGLGGYTLARELRKRDRDTPLVLVSADDGAFYSKPALSNALAQGKTPDQLSMGDAATMAAQLGAEVRPHTRVEAIDPAHRHVILPDGTLEYGRLVLTLGADPLHLPLAGDGTDAVLSVNDLADYGRFRAALVGARRVVILGAGLIGCEFANDLVAAGLQVAVVDPGEMPLGRLAPPTAAAALRDALATAGVAWHFGTVANAVTRSPDGVQVHLADGTVLAADLVLSAVGLRPRTGLAQAAGLAVERGIRVDRLLTTSDPGIHALGDCAEVAGLVLPFVMPIMHAARALAATLAGQPTAVSYPAMPVVVKTPAHPVVVAPPAADATGEWDVATTADGVRALYRGADGALLGFYLSGAATADKQRLTRELPPVLA